MATGGYSERLRRVNCPVTVEDQVNFAVCGRKPRSYAGSNLYVVGRERGRGHGGVGRMRLDGDAAGGRRDGGEDLTAPGVDVQDASGAPSGQPGQLQVVLRNLLGDGAASEAGEVPTTKGNGHRRVNRPEKLSSSCMQQPWHALYHHPLRNRSLRAGDSASDQ